MVLILPTIKMMTGSLLFQLNKIHLGNILPTINNTAAASVIEIRARVFLRTNK